MGLPITQEHLSHIRDQEQRVTSPPLHSVKMDLPSTTTNLDKASSDRKVYLLMQKGFETIIVQTGGGLILGGLAGIVLSRGGRGASARKLLAGMGAGVGLGSAWTRTSIDLEKLLQKDSPSE